MQAAMGANNAMEWLSFMGLEDAMDAPPSSDGDGRPRSREAECDHGSHFRCIARLYPATHDNVAARGAFARGCRGALVGRQLATTGRSAGVLGRVLDFSILLRATSAFGFF